MRSRHHAQLLAIARRHAGASAAEDVVQEAYLAAIEAGRLSVDDPETVRWLAGVIRNRARMMRRGLGRSRAREQHWQGLRPAAETARDAAPSLPPDLPPALRAVAVLAVTGHTRREIGYLLGLTDVALRQRLAALKRRLASAGLATPGELTGLSLDLAYGRIRDALLPALTRHAALFASHDPDGHLFFVRHSRNAVRRQLTDAHEQEGSP